MSEEQKPVGDEPKPVKVKKERKTRGKPTTLNNQQVELVNRMNKGKNLTDAAEGVYSSPAAAHRALQRVRIVASDAIHEMGLKPHMWLKELAKVAGIEGVQDPEESGKREVFVKASLFQQEKKVKLYDPNVKVKACAELNKAYYAGDESGQSEPGSGRTQIVINLGFLAPERAEAILRLQSGSRANSGTPGLPG